MRAWSMHVRNEHTKEIVTLVVESETFTGAQIAAVTRAFHELKWPKSLALARSDEASDVLLDAAYPLGYPYYRAEEIEGQRHLSLSESRLVAV